MLRFVAASLVILSGFGNLALAQQPPTTQSSAASSSQEKPRVFITDSNSWSTQAAAGGSRGSFGASSSGGARPQTAEIIKTFGQRCPQAIVNNRADASNYIVELDHEGGKSVFAHKDKIAVFVQKTGDSIFSKSTLSVGGSVQDACAALLAHWATHSSELAAVQNGDGQGGGTPSPTPQTTSLTVDASVPNCDIEIDGNFVGNTPSTLTVASGKHEITVKKTGYAPWTRSMMVGVGSVRLSADMVKQ